MDTYFQEAVLKVSAHVSEEGRGEIDPLYHDCPDSFEYQDLHPLPL